MADNLTGGSAVFAPSDNTMAAAIERNMNALLTTPLPAENTPEARDRRRFFAAIARGVIEHLKENPTALEVVFTDVPGGSGNLNDYEAHVQVKATDV